ncbi:MAG: AAA family ATPase [Cyanobacteria bacterium P01_G01_bin.54]
MEEIFVTKIDIHQARNVKDLTIELSEAKRRHLIITGKNGSGKTSLLLELNKYLQSLIKGEPVDREWLEGEIKNVENDINKLEVNLDSSKDSKQDIDIVEQLNQEKNIHTYYVNRLELLGETDIEFNSGVFIEKNKLHQSISDGRFLVISFKDQRIVNPRVPSGIKKIELKGKRSLESSLSSEFTQHLVNLKADRSFARDDGESDVVLEIDNWFDDLERKLRQVFDSASLNLKFNRKEYNFKISEEGKEPYGFNQLSAGYSAIIDIVSELILRIGSYGAKAYNIQGLVLIDEIETHLHVDLQKKILPLLTSFFPKIQFIVTTHSPFVISSVPNAVVCDLEKRLVINDTDLSGYSYDTLIESYFGANKYSNYVRQNLDEYEELVRNKDNLSPEQELRLLDLEEYFDSLPGYLGDLNSELSTRLSQIKMDML